MQIWRFLYAKTTRKKAVEKTGAAIPGETAFVITEGIDYAECLRKAMHEAKFKESQLLGSRQL